MIQPQTGVPTLILDELIVLDGATGDQVSSWEAPREKYVVFGDNNQAFYTFDYDGSGPGIASVDIYSQRTATFGSDEEEFENMNAAGIGLSAGHNYAAYRFGRDPSSASDKSPMGIGRLYLENGHASDHAVIRLRVWVVLQAYRPQEFKLSAGATANTSSLPVGGSVSGLAGMGPMAAVVPERR